MSPDFSCDKEIFHHCYSGNLANGWGRGEIITEGNPMKSAVQPELIPGSLVLPTYAGLAGTAPAESKQCDSSRRELDSNFQMLLQYQPQFMRFNVSDNCPPKIARPKAGTRH